MFDGFEGLLTLSRREGVDVRPTLLRVLTDLYVQARTHTREEERQFVELASRLIDDVDDATRAAVHARLSIYPHTPPLLLARLAMRPAPPRAPMPQAADPAAIVARKPIAVPAKEPNDAADISAMFFAANRKERGAMLMKLHHMPLTPAAKIRDARAARAIATLEAAAFAADTDAFTRELSAALMLPPAITAQVVADAGREPLACALKALGMPSQIFQRVLMFLDPAFGASVENVYRLSRFYDVLSERASLAMLAAWRGADVATTRATYKSSLYDDDRARVRRTIPQTRPVIQPGALAAPRVSRGQ